MRLIVDSQYMLTQGTKVVLLAEKGAHIIHDQEIDSLVFNIFNTSSEESR